MNFRVERSKNEEDPAVYSVSGRIQAEHTGTLRELLARETRRVVLDLMEVVLVDREAVRFLASCESNGIGLRNCPPYIREWLRREAGSNSDGNHG